MVFITAHQELKRTGADIDKYSGLLGGTLVSRPSASTLGCKYRRDDPALKAYRPELLVAKLGDQWRKGYPKATSSRIVLVTSYQSWPRRVLGNVPVHRYQYSATPKAHRLDPDEITIVTPALVFVDEAHECQGDKCGHYATLNQINSMCDYRVKKVFLTGTPIKKGPGDLLAMIIHLEDIEWDDPQHFMHGLRSSVIVDMQEKFKKITSPDDHQLSSLTNSLAQLVPKVMIRRTNQSRWFGMNMRPPVEMNKQDATVNFPAQYIPFLEQFDERIRHRFRDQQMAQQQKRSGGDPGAVSKKALLSTTRYYRMMTSIPFLAQYWSTEQNTEETFLNESMVHWLDVECRIRPECPLYPHLETIIKTSPKLEFVGRILGGMVRGQGKLLILSEYLLVLAIVVEYIRKHPTGKSVLLYHSGIDRSTREQMVQGFQQKKDSKDIKATKTLYAQFDTDAIVGTFGVMGLGVTLTKADRVVILEPNTLPSVEIQGIARAVRITQKNKVEVRRLLCPTVKVEKTILSLNALRSYFMEGSLGKEEDT
ncbi:MAG: hypothetical protein Q9196_005295 [Gyalolechia fulgens]